VGDNPRVQTLKNRLALGGVQLAYCLFAACWRRQQAAVQHLITVPLQLLKQPTPYFSDMFTIAVHDITSS
jgi:hypothetical protein